MVKNIVLFYKNNSLYNVFHSPQKMENKQDDKQE